MTEEEFCFWRDERLEYDQLVAEAVKKQPKPKEDT